MIAGLKRVVVGLYRRNVPEKHQQYITYLKRHKVAVYQASRGQLPLSRRLLHDWTKLLPSEWNPYADFFYMPKGGKKGKTVAEQRKNVAAAELAAFNVAWLLHQNRNPHHWQFWVLLRDDGDIEALKMPHTYAVEMLADWRGAGLAAGNPDTAAWYRANSQHMIMHPETRAWIEAQLGVR